MIQTPETNTSASLVHIVCPQCGGNLELSENSRVSRCPYCRSFSLLLGRYGTFQYYLPNQIESKQAQQIIRAAIVKRNKNISPTLQDMTLYYVPFWRIHGTLLGWVLGRQEVEYTRDQYDRNPENNRPRVQTIKEIVGDRAVEKLIRRSGVVTISACHVTEMGIPTLGSQHQGYYSGMGIHKKSFLDLRVLEDMNRVDGIFLDITIPHEAARTDAQQFFRQMAEGTGHQIHKTYETYRVVTQQMSLVFYPIWFCRYSVRGRQYTATVDGINRKILDGRVPSDRRLTLLVTFSLMVALAFVISGISRFFFLPGILAGPASSHFAPSLLLSLVGLLFGLAVLIGFALINQNVKSDTNLVEREESANHPF